MRDCAAAATTTATTALTPKISLRYCPLCCELIKRVEPHDGDEHERYWAWVHEVKPPLPARFPNRFAKAAAGLTKGEYRTRGALDAMDERSSGTQVCAVS